MSHCLAQVKHTTQRMTHSNSHTGLLLWRLSRVLQIHGLFHRIDYTSYRESLIWEHETGMILRNVLHQTIQGLWLLQYFISVNITKVGQQKMVCKTLIHLYCATLSYYSTFMSLEYRRKIRRHTWSINMSINMSILNTVKELWYAYELDFPPSQTTTILKVKKKKHSYLHISRKCTSPNCLNYVITIINTYNVCEIK